MNESIVQTTKEITDDEFLRQSYIRSHLLANVELCSELIEFIKQSQKSGTRVTVDSYLSGILDVDRVYEFTMYAHLQKDSTVTIVSDLWAIPVDQTYDNVIAVGLPSFKYKTITEYAECIDHLLKITSHGGILVVCLPKLHLQYHRLQYQTIDIITQLKKLICGTITDLIELEYNFYLKIQNEQ
jgi:hypothetical protein